MMTVNEQTTAYLNVSFRDRDGNLAAPTSITYRIDCVTTGTAVLASTGISPATEVEITITPAQNAILDTSNAKEHKRLTVIAVYGANDRVTSNFNYSVLNLSGVS